MKQLTFLVERCKGGSSSADLGRCHLCAVAKCCINPRALPPVPTVVLNMQTMQIPPLCYDLASYSQGIIRERLGPEAALEPESEGRKRTPRAQLVRG